MSLVGRDFSPMREALFLCHAHCWKWKTRGASFSALDIIIINNPSPTPYMLESYGFFSNPVYIFVQLHVLPFFDSCLAYFYFLILGSLQLSPTLHLATTTTAKKTKEGREQGVRRQKRTVPESIGFTSRPLALRYFSRCRVQRFL